MSLLAKFCAVVIFLGWHILVWGAEGPIIIAHRGASGYLPEHTLESKALAYGMGADYLEQDVVLSKDDRPFVLHDIHLDTVTDVAEVFSDRARSDGRYYAIDFTADEIKRLHVHERVDLTKKTAVYAGRFPIGSSSFQVPTLAEEIELIQGLNKSTGRNVGIYTEIKAPVWHRDQGKDISKIVLLELARFGYRNRNDKAYVQCFDFAETRRLRHELRTNLRLVQLLAEKDWKVTDSGDENSEVAARLRQIAQYADGIGPSMTLIVRGVNDDGEPISTSLVDQAHRVGLEVHPYTLRADALPDYVDSLPRLLEILFVDVGVDGVFTDFPDLAVTFRDAEKESLQTGPK